MPESLSDASRRGEIGWAHDHGVDRVTVHHIAALSRRRVRDVEFALWCEDIEIEPRLRTVATADVLEKWPNV